MMGARSVAAACNVQDTCWVGLTEDMALTSLRAIVASTMIFWAAHWASDMTATMRGLRDALSVFVGGRWNVALKVHPVVEDAYDFDRVVRRSPIHEEMASSMTASHDMERAKTRHDLVADLGAWNIGAAGKFANRLKERIPIDARLPRTKILGSPSQDVRKVEFGSSTKSDAPSLLGHNGSTRLFRR